MASTPLERDLPTLAFNETLNSSGIREQPERSNSCSNQPLDQNEHSVNQPEFVIHMAVIASQLDPTPEILTGDGEETEESVWLAETALSTAHLRESTGFNLRCKQFICSYPLEITPTIGYDLLVTPAVGWRIEFLESGADCYCFFPNQWKTIRLIQEGREILSFIYRPESWCPWRKKAGSVDIYIPKRANRIGRIEYEAREDFEESAVVADFISNSVFHVSKLKTNSGNMAMKILNKMGVPLAIAHSSRGTSVYGLVTWHDFEMNCSLFRNLYSPASVKAVLLVTYIMWVLKYQERDSRRTCMGAGILLGLIFVLALFASLVPK